MNSTRAGQVSRSIRPLDWVVLGVSVVLACAAAWPCIWPYIDHTRRVKATESRLSVLGYSLLMYKDAYAVYPGESSPPGPVVLPMAVPVRVLAARGYFKNNEVAKEHCFDGWGNQMVYLLYDYRSSTPTVPFKVLNGVPSGDWTRRLGPMIRAGRIGTRNGWPILVSAGPDGVFGTEDDIMDYEAPGAYFGVIGPKKGTGVVSEPQPKE